MWFIKISTNICIFLLSDAFFKEFKRRTAIKQERPECTGPFKQMIQNIFGSTDDVENLFDTIS